MEWYVEGIGAKAIAPPPKKQIVKELRIASLSEDKLAPSVKKLPDFYVNPLLRGISEMVFARNCDIHIKKSKNTPVRTSFGAVRSADGTAARGAKVDL